MLTLSLHKMLSFVWVTGLQPLQGRDKARCASLHSAESPVASGYCCTLHRVRSLHGFCANDVNDGYSGGSSSDCEWPTMTSNQRRARSR